MIDMTLPYLIVGFLVSLAFLLYSIFVQIRWEADPIGRAIGLISKPSYKRFIVSLGVSTLFLWFILGSFGIDPYVRLLFLFGFSIWLLVVGFLMEILVKRSVKS